MDSGVPTGVASGKRDRSSPEFDNKETKRANITMEAKLDLLLKAVEEFKVSQKEFKSSLEEVNATQGDIKKELAEFKQSIQEKESRWQEERADLVSMNKQLESRLDQLERNERRNNAILSGVDVSRENATGVVKELFAKLDPTIKTSEIRDFKTQAGASKIFVRFANLEDKMKVFKAKQKLTISDNKGASRPVFINDDLSKKDQQINFLARKLARDFRAHNKTVKLAYRKLCVDGEWLAWNEEGEKFEAQKN